MHSVYLRICSPLNLDNMMYAVLSSFISHLHYVDLEKTQYTCAFSMYNDI